MTLLDADLIGKLSEPEQIIRKFRVDAISPDEGKYANATDKLRPYLSAASEWRECASLQATLLETRHEFGKADAENVEEIKAALSKIDPANITMLEDHPKIMHDQLAVIEEIGRFVSPRTKAQLHPGTTSYDILDTVRPYLIKKAWNEIFRPKVSSVINQLCGLGERSINILQVGRTHLQDTSPVIFGGTLAGYGARLADRVEQCDFFFNNLRGKISGIVGTGASIDMVIGEGKSLEFEKAVLAKLNLKPDYTATQVTQKEKYSDVAHGITTLVRVLGDFTNDTRMLYSSAIKEVTSRDNAERLGGSSADATKNNPIQYENISGKVPIVESAMRVVYDMISTDFQRDLRGSVQARYQPALMMVEAYEMFSRVDKALANFSINEDVIAENLKKVRRNPGEAMVAILRGHEWIHSQHGIGHDFVKIIGREAIKTSRGLTVIALEDPEFAELYNERMSQTQRDILDGQLEKYIGSAPERARMNIDYARRIASLS